MFVGGARGQECEDLPRSRDSEREMFPPASVLATPCQVWQRMVGMCVALPRLALVACVLSSLFLHSDAWTAAGSVRNTFPQQRSSLHRTHVSSGGSAPAEPDEQQSVPPVKQQQPWWEEERRTRGMPTLSRATQWRMFLTLKVQPAAVTCGFNDVFDSAVRCSSLPTDTHRASVQSH